MSANGASPEVQPDEAGPESDAPQPPGTPQAATVPDDLSEQLQAALAKAAELTDALQRKEAEFRNYRRQAESRAQSGAAEGTKKVLKGLLGVLDAFDAALAQGERAIEPVARLLGDTLAEFGLGRVDTVGHPFDPATHEAVPNADGTIPQGERLVVATELRAGWSFEGVVLRPAMVQLEPAASDRPPDAPAAG